MTQEGLKSSFLENREYTLAKDEYTATAYDNFMALAISVRDRLVERWMITQQRYHKKNVKRVYYLSMEFLIGRLLNTNILNLSLWEQAKGATKGFGFNIEELEEEERDAGLGNGGLGRLAACFLDSMATLKIPAHGYGIRYEYGIFHQRLINGYQFESPDEWLKLGNPWEIARPEYTVTVRFYGSTYMFHDKHGRLHVKWHNTQDVLAMPYDIPVPGYNNDTVNTLRLWAARSTEEFDFGYFNYGDYEKAVYNKVSSENISKVLYPNDVSNQGKELRLKQEYFFVAASVADIIRRFKSGNEDLTNIAKKVVIQLNDTHPALAVVEFLRILLDEENFSWEAAWAIVVETFAYTNHTVMPEALEVWPVSLFASLLPRHLELIYEINLRFLRVVANRYPGDNAKLGTLSLIEEGSVQKIRMAYLAIVASHSVNGVSRLHTHILKTRLFRDFFELFPEKFNNKTNGITQRRWLLKANTKLSGLITECIGDRWATNLYELERLLKFQDDENFRRRWRAIKHANKQSLANYIGRTTGIRVDPEAIFDVQVKRIHEYKRQLLFVFYIIHEYLKIKENPKAPYCPRVFLVSGKSAPGYFMAKHIIKFINNVADVINKDLSISGKLKLVFLENYGVSLAEKIFPASDLSEQISTAGSEASGTGCMKFMVNGALTIGTYDGANIEMAEAVGKENIFLFGLSFDQVRKLKAKGYRPQEYIQQIPRLKEILALIRNNFFSPQELRLFDPLVENISNYDEFLVCADFAEYCQTQELISREYQNKGAWTKKSIENVARSGYFSSDRTIQEYAKEIWRVPYDRKSYQRVKGGNYGRRKE